MPWPSASPHCAWRGRWRPIRAARTTTSWVVREITRPAPPAVAQVPSQRPPVIEPAFVEVDEVGVRLYQLTPTSQSREAIQVAFIVDPHLEL